MFKVLNAHKKRVCDVTKDMRKAIIRIAGCMIIIKANSDGTLSFLGATIKSH